MDIRLREIAGGPAGTYFIVKDNSTVEEITTISNLRLIPINVEPGPVNTLVVFQKGDTTGFTSIFGKGLRKHEKQGNFSIKSCLTALKGGPIAVINLRAFDSAVDLIGVNGMSPNKTLPETAESAYQNVFNINGFWAPKSKNLPGLLSAEHLLNFANIGKGNISYFVTISNSVETLTDQGNVTLSATELEIEDYPGLSKEMLVKDTFVDVWIFNNSFNADSVSTNQFYGQLFNEAGLINFDKLQDLANIKESGFNRKITGSLIPFLKNEFDENISIDTIMNAVYAETGLVSYINYDVLELESIDLGLPVINSKATGYMGVNGALIGNGNLLSHRLQVETAAVVDLDSTETLIVDNTKKALVEYKGTIFATAQGDQLPLNGNKVVSSFNSGIRAGDTVFYEDTDESKLVEVTVKTVELTGHEETTNLPTGTQVSLIVMFDISTADSAFPTISVPSSPAGGNMKFQLWKKLSTDVNYTLLLDNFQQYTGGSSFKDLDVDQTKTYNYVLLNVGDAEHTSVFTDSFSAKLGAIPLATLDVNPVFPLIPSNANKKAVYKECVLTLTGNVKSTKYYRRLTPLQNGNGKVQFTNLAAYVPRVEQFTNGSASRQSEILDVLNSPSVLKGLKNFSGIRYFTDAFKSFVEGSYKYQFGQLTYELDKCNKFVRGIVNEPFIEDLEDSLNPLFRQSPGGAFDIKYLETGGNPAFSTKFLTKFTIGAEFCFFFGSGSVVEPNVEPIAANVSNAFVAKTFPWDVVANESGYLDGITSIELNPDDSERKAMEKFRWNPLIKLKNGFTIYGNLTGIVKRSALQQIHNSELLAYIKESLYNMSQSENFKKGTYDEYLRLETQVQAFMDALAQQGAIQPNPIVICNASNNTSEISKQKIKLCHVEYTNIDALDKIVFDLELN